MFFSCVRHKKIVVIRNNRNFNKSWQDGAKFLVLCTITCEHFFYILTHCFWLMKMSAFQHFGSRLSETKRAIAEVILYFTIMLLFFQVQVRVVESRENDTTECSARVDFF